MTITAPEFDFIRDLVRRESAIVLEPSKAYLVETRLAPLVRRARVASIADLVGQLRADDDGRLRHQIVEAMTTNETLWFRDIAPFNALRDHVIPQLVRDRARERTLTIWSAACSSGQEPYSVAMVIKDHFPELAGWRISILASDISDEMLQRAVSGRYSDLEVSRGLPPDALARHFRRAGTAWEIDPELRRMVTFGRINLAASWPDVPSCDVVLLRNVLIYFDLVTKREVLGRMRRVLRPDGFVFLGTSETTLNVDDEFQRVPLGPAVGYQMNPGSAL